MRRGRCCHAEGVDRPSGVVRPTRPAASPPQTWLSKGRAQRGLFHSPYSEVKAPTAAAVNSALRHSGIIISTISNSITLSGERASASSRRHRARALLQLPPSRDWRAQGRPGAGRARGLPAEKNAGSSHHRFGRTRPALPARRFYALYVISPGTGCLAPVTRALVAARLRQRLRVAHGISTGMPGPHDFGVRTGAFVGEALSSAARRRVHRIP